MEAEEQPKESASKYNYIVSFNNRQAPGFCAVNYICGWKMHPDCGDLTIKQLIARRAEEVFYNSPYGYNHVGRIFPLFYSFSFDKQPSEREIALKIVGLMSAPNIVRFADVLGEGMHLAISNHLVHGEEITTSNGYRWKVIKHEPMRNYNSGNMVMEVDLLRLDRSRYSL